MALAHVCFDLVLTAASLRVTEVYLHVAWLLAWFGPFGFSRIARPVPAYLVLPPNLAHAVFSSGWMPFAPVLYLDNVDSSFKMQVRFYPLKAGYGHSSELSEFPVHSSRIVFTPFCAHLLFSAMGPSLAWELQQGANHVSFTFDTLPAWHIKGTQVFLRWLAWSLAHQDLFMSVKGD